MKGKFVGRCPATDGKMLRPRAGGAARGALRMACDSAFSEGEESGAIAHGDLPTLGERASGAIGAVAGCAADAAQVAKFPSCHSACCDCAATGGKKEACDRIHVYDDDQNIIASFGPRYGAMRGEDGSVIVYKVPAAPATTQDAIIDDIVAVMRQRLAAVNAAGLIGINKANEEFWKRGDA